MSSALDKASERATVAERRVAQLEDELAKKSSVLANKVTEKCSWTDKSKIMTNVSV